MTQKLKFPKGFLWGSATAAHQIEGNNTNSDWWVWENSLKRHNELISEGKNPKDFVSDLACDSYNRYDEDFALAEQLSHNAHRLSIEWARIEPKENHFSENALDHYEKVLQSAKYHGLTTFVTLHHFTLPNWFAKKRGFEKKENIHNFVEYSKIVVKRLSEYTDFWITFNEPQVYSSVPFRFGLWPPQKKSLFLAFKVAVNLIKAHNAVAPYIKKATGKPVGLAHHLVGLEPLGWLSNKTTLLLNKKINNFILDRTVKNSDFIGVNNYFFHRIGLFGKQKHPKNCHKESDISWPIHPEGMGLVLMSLKKYNKPVYITENGIADSKDKLRSEFIKDNLYYVHKAIKKGVDIRGYLYWSLIDNFEWAMGFAPRFGLIAIDREDNLKRKIRSSAFAYAKICKNNLLEY